MATFYEVDLMGQAQGQSIVNTLYYLRGVGSTNDWDPEEADEVALAAIDLWQDNVMISMSSEYQFNGVNVSMINEDRDVLSPFVVARSASGNGGVVSEPDTVAICLIASFQCTFVTSGTGLRVPRRSYLAIGPLGTMYVGPSGVLTLPQANRDLIQDALEASLTISGPVTLPAARVGQESPLNGPSAGLVVNNFVRPYVSFRRSRMRTTTGQF